MNAYYRNLIKGHSSRPRDIARALAGDFDRDEGRRNLQVEAASHVRVQAWLDDRAGKAAIGEPGSTAFIVELHRALYEQVPAAVLQIQKRPARLRDGPGKWRTHEVVVGRHQPPSSAYLPAFMDYFSFRVAW